MIPEKVQKVFNENPKIMVVVDGENRYYRGMRAYLGENPAQVSP